MDQSWPSSLSAGDLVIVKRDSPGGKHRSVERVESVRKSHVLVAGVLYRRKDGFCAGRRVLYPSHLVPWTEELGEKVERETRLRDARTLLRLAVALSDEELLLKVADALAPLDAEIRRA